MLFGFILRLICKRVLCSDLILSATLLDTGPTLMLSELFARRVQDLALRLDGLGLSCKGDSEALGLALQASTEALLAASRRSDECAEARATRLEERARADALEARRESAALEGSVSVP